MRIGVVDQRVIFPPAIRLLYEEMVLLSENEFEDLRAHGAQNPIQEIIIQFLLETKCYRFHTRLCEDSALRGVALFWEEYEASELDFRFLRYLVQHAVIVGTPNRSDQYLTVTEGYGESEFRAHPMAGGRLFVVYADHVFEGPSTSVTRNTLCKNPPTDWMYGLLVPYNEEVVTEICAYLGLTPAEARRLYQEELQLGIQSSANPEDLFVELYLWGVTTENEAGEAEAFVEWSYYSSNVDPEPSDFRCIRERVKQEKLTVEAKYIGRIR